MEVYSESPEMIKRISILAIVFVIGCMSSFAKKRALLIGIGNYDYTATGWSVIHGNNDVALLESKLKAKKK